MGAVLAGVLLDGNAGVNQPVGVAKVAGNGFEVETISEQNGSVARFVLQDVGVGGEALGGEQRGFQAHAAGVAAVGGLGHGTGVGGNSSGPRCRDSQGHAGLLGVQPQHH